VIDIDPLQSMRRPSALSIKAIALVGGACTCSRCQVEEDRSLPTILERKAEMRGELNSEHKGAYDKSRY
jgi:hypothetical protein